MSKLASITEKIVDEAVAVWWRAAENGTVASIPHLSAAVRTAVRCGLPYRDSGVPDFLRRQKLLFQPMRLLAVLRALALLRTADGSKETREFLLKHLQDSNAKTRQIALEAIVSQRTLSNDPETVNAVIGVLESDHITVRKVAARLVLTWLEADPPPELRTRIERLMRSNERVRFVLETARIGTPSYTLEGDTATVTQSGPRNTRQQSHAEVLRYIQQLNDMDPGLRERAARNLGQLHRDGARVYLRNGRYVVLLPSETRGRSRVGGSLK